MKSMMREYSVRQKMHIIVILYHSNNENIFRKIFTNLSVHSLTTAKFPSPMILPISYL
jgi:hypothetical protein